MYTNVVAEYPEDGFAILEDGHGKFVAFKDKEELVQLSTSPASTDWPVRWKNPNNFNLESLQVE